MVLQQTLSRNVRADVWMDILQLITGLSLLIFLWVHLLAVSSIVISHEAFILVALIIEEWHLLTIAGISIPVFIIAHVISAGRKIPVRFRDQRIVWKTAVRSRHWDSITWIWQVISGMAILVLVMVHIVTVTFSPGIIESAGNAAVKVHTFDRMSSLPWIIFYALLLIIGETHASVGLYRQFIKWGFLKRRLANIIAFIATIFFLSLGAVALVAFVAHATGPVPSSYPIP